MLTKKQHELLLFIHKRLEDDGVSPSFEEMKAALDLKSKSGIHRLISALEERGFLRRLPHRARALEVVRMPADSVPDTRPTQVPIDAANVIRGSFGAPRPHAVAIAEAADAVDLPLYGKIAAGAPIEALRDPEGHMGVPASMLDPKRRHYALSIDGDSMIDAGILDGDVVVIEECETASDGEIVVALVDEEEATLKRLRRRGSSVALEAANPAYETRIFGPDRVKVQGRLVGLIRQYH
ncbi:MAG: transcriptional repressor LexA [Proteobacteria bacterium]|nr:transcriptional repressor LexA [Pseudomonadota bacterium]MDA1060034.1 transcriptional repressor LexA [Pseudomonadota bacterium]